MNISGIAYVGENIHVLYFSTDWNTEESKWNTILNIWCVCKKGSIREIKTNLRGKIFRRLITGGWNYDLKRDHFWYHIGTRWKVGRKPKYTSYPITVIT